MELIPGYMGPRVRAKLGTMRKERDFHIMPTDQEGILIVQADRAIGRFDFRTGEGILNIKGEYFLHLHPQLGAKPFDFPPEFVKLCLEACPTLDGETDLGGVIVQHTVRTI